MFGSSVWGNEFPYNLPITRDSWMVTDSAALPHLDTSIQSMAGDHAPSLGDAKFNSHLDMALPPVDRNTIASIRQPPLVAKPPVVLAPPTSFVSPTYSSSSVIPFIFPRSTLLHFIYH